MASTFEEEQSLRECENYIQTHSIQRVLKDCIVQLCVIRPDNPISFLRQYFQKLERVSTANLQQQNKTEKNYYEQKRKERLQKLDPIGFHCNTTIYT